jgi:hypothetical protein
MPLRTSANWRRNCQRVGVVLAGALGLALLPKAAQARSKLQGVAQASLGYSDNIRSGPDHAVYDPATGELLLRGKSADAFAILSPGAVYAIETAAAIHRLTYAYTAHLFLTNPAANVYSNRLEWRGFMSPAPRLELMLGARAMQSHRHTENTLFNASETAVTATLPGTGAFIRATADEGLTYRLSPEWSLHQGIAGGLQAPVFDDRGPKTYFAGGRLGLEHAWEMDALGVETRARYVAFDGTVLTRTGVVGDQSQLITELVGTWRHDWNPDFSSRVEAGAANVQLITRDRQFWQPVGLAALSYFREEGEAELSYRHALTTSVFLGVTFLTDEVRLSGAIPLDRHARMFVASSVAYQHSRILDVQGELATRLNVFLGDVSFGYRVLDHLELAARYQHIEQASGADLPPLPLSYVRNTAFITATLEYPPDREMPRTYHEARRVDRSDTFDRSQEDRNQPTGGATPRP